MEVIPIITSQVRQYAQYFEKVCVGFTNAADEYLAKQVEETGRYPEISFFIEINEKNNSDNILLQSNKIYTVKQALEWVRSLDFIALDQCNVWLMYWIEGGDIDLAGIVDFHKVLGGGHII